MPLLFSSPKLPCFSNSFFRLLCQLLIPFATLLPTLQSRLWHISFVLCHLHTPFNELGRFAKVSVCHSRPAYSPPGTNTTPTAPGKLDVQLCHIFNWITSPFPRSVGVPEGLCQGRESREVPIGTGWRGEQLCPSGSQICQFKLFQTQTDKCKQPKGTFISYKLTLCKIILLFLCPVVVPERSPTCPRLLPTSDFCCPVEEGSLWLAQTDQYK